MMDFNNPNNNWRKPDGGQRESHSLMTIVMTMLFVVAMMAMMWLFSGCTTTKYVPVVESHTDTLHIIQHQRDSIYLHDSIRVSEKGDTVLVERWHTKYREKQVHDTIYQSKTDSIPVPYEVIKEVSAKLSKTQKGLMTLGILTLMAAVIFGAFWIKKILRL